MSVHPEGGVIVVPLETSTVSPATSTSPFATLAGLPMPSVVAPEDEFDYPAEEPKAMVHVPPPPPLATLRAISCAA